MRKRPRVDLRDLEDETQRGSRVCTDVVARLRAACEVDVIFVSREDGERQSLTVFAVDADDDAFSRCRLAFEGVELEGVSAIYFERITGDGEKALLVRELGFDVGQSMAPDGSLLSWSQFGDGVLDGAQ